MHSSDLSRGRPNLPKRMHAHFIHKWPLSEIYPRMIASADLPQPRESLSSLVPLPHCCQLNVRHKQAGTHIIMDAA